MDGYGGLASRGVGGQVWVPRDRKGVGVLSRLLLLRILGPFAMYSIRAVVNRELQLEALRTRGSIPLVLLLKVSLQPHCAPASKQSSGSLFQLST